MSLFNKDFNFQFNDNQHFLEIVLQWNNIGKHARKRADTSVSIIDYVPGSMLRALRTHVQLYCVEAEMAQNRILELKEQEFNMQYQQLVFQHQQR